VCVRVDERERERGIFCWDNMERSEKFSSEKVGSLCSSNWCFLFPHRPQATTILTDKQKEKISKVKGECFRKRKERINVSFGRNKPYIQTERDHEDPCGCIFLHGGCTRSLHTQLFSLALSLSLTRLMAMLAHISLGYCLPANVLSWLMGTALAIRT